MDLEQCNFTQEEKDIIITAIVLHDGWKHGDKGSNFTVIEHPTICAAWLEKTTELHGYLSDEGFEKLKDGISSHMGQWVTDKSKKEVLPKPKTEIQKFIHVCDYLASRKWLIVDFEDDNYDGTYEAPKPETAPSEISTVLAEIITVCKAKIAEGIPRESVYELIENTAGVKNPNKIADLETAKLVLNKLKEINT